MKNKLLMWLVSAGLLAGVVAFAPAFANAQTVSGQGNNSNAQGQQGQEGQTRQFFNGAHRPGVGQGIAGTVTAVNGTTLTVSAMPRMHPTSTSTSTSTPTIYTVDASKAKVLKNGTSTTVSSIATGDTVFVQGNVSGTTVTATTIMDGIPMGGRSFGQGQHATSTQPVSPIKGNGEPIVGGSITAVSGTTLTVTNTSSITYTIDISGATIVKNGTTTAASDLAVGDNVIVQGTVNGTNITASSVLDQSANAQSGSGNSSNGHQNAIGGFFGKIGNFFQHLFGF